jgi:hypothetical protein
MRDLSRMWGEATEAGRYEKVAGLVYIAALAPSRSSASARRACRREQPSAAADRRDRLPRT